MKWKKIKESKTLFQKRFWDKRWLSTLLCKNNKKLLPQVVRKAQWGRKINSTSEFEIYASLIENNMIRVWEINITELFSLVD